jgi:ABC-type Mn2+/Zn2+ transport system ATPase subunit
MTDPAPAIPRDDGPHRLTVEDVHIHYGAVCALEDVTFETSCGRAVALVGGNGAGKTTLLKTLVGLIPASSGRVLWRGRPVKRSTHEIAYLPQRAEIDWTFPMTVRALVEMGRYALLGPWKRYRDADEQAVRRAMKTMGLEPLAERQIGALSGGQQQRAFVARALAQESHVLLLDEPFAGLDEPARDALAALIRDLVENGRLVVASHHDLSTVESLFDEVLLLNRRMIAFGPPSEVMTRDRLKRTFAERTSAEGRC